MRKFLVSNLFKRAHSFLDTTVNQMLIIYPFARNIRNLLFSCMVLRRERPLVGNGKVVGIRCFEFLMMQSLGMFFSLISCFFSILHSPIYRLYPCSLGHVHRLVSCLDCHICCLCADHNHLDLLRLRKLAQWARDPHVVTVNREYPLQEWYHADGPLVLVGQAAQPIAVSHDRSFCCTHLNVCFLSQVLCKK